ncbi:MAG: hypothetical protein FJW40_09060 [Acidobacteria bacterium]|nr:hypothetical protein [Acidobacteriota bacterium]
MAVPAATQGSQESPRHSAVIRVTHWITALCFIALVVTGAEIVISHPRFYWGEAGHVHMPALFQLPIPASRGSVPTGYSFVLKDQNGWSRSLHFQSAWFVVFAGIAYAVSVLRRGYFRRHLLPESGTLSPANLGRVAMNHLRLRRPPPEEAWSYNPLQRLAYLGVVLFLFPLMIWTGLAMSPGFTAAFPFTAEVFGGQQSARTIHFFATLALLGFFFTHIAMVILAGFRSRMRSMIAGNPSKERSS